MASRRTRPTTSSNRRRCTVCKRMKVGAAYRTPRMVVCRKCERRDG